MTKGSPVNSEDDVDTLIELKPVPPRIKAPPPPPPPRPQNPPKASTSKERRKNPRFALRSRVLMIWGQSVYRTFTIDASIDGLRLEHAVPKELVGKLVDCFLSGPDSRSGLHFRGLLVGAATERVRLRFVEQNPQNQKQLQQWISALAKRKPKAA